MIVNWVKEDEELIEPYEWMEYDDLEELSSVDVYKVDDKTFYDFVYGCMQFKEEEYWNCIFGVCNKNSVLFVETNKQGKLIYRGVCDYPSRTHIIEATTLASIEPIEYHLYDEGFVKEFGLTRYERIKKQSLESRIDELYIESYDEFVDLCDQLGIHEDQSVGMYITVKKKIEKGYTFLHELLYEQLVKNT